MKGRANSTVNPFKNRIIHFKNQWSSAARIGQLVLLFVLDKTEGANTADLGYQFTLKNRNSSLIRNEFVHYCEWILFDLRYKSESSIKINSNVRKFPIKLLV